MKNPLISIVIRTLNEERYLAQLLDGIYSQVIDFDFEIILIDSGSTDRTVSIAEKYGCHILTISREQFSFGRSLNWACNAALGTFFVFVSGHCIPVDEYWLANLILPLRDGLAEYSYGRQLAGTHSCWSEHCIYDKYFPPVSRIPQIGYFCNNANSALLKSTWIRYNFDESLTGLEDMHLAKRIEADQGSIAYVANASVFHLHHETWSQVWRRFEREALALRFITPELILKRRDFIRYFFRAVFNDLRTLPSHRIAFNEIYNIILYRYHQFRGSFCGNQISRIVSASLKDSYFYPTSKKGAALAPKY